MTIGYRRSTLQGCRSSIRPRFAVVGCILGQQTRLNACFGCLCIMHNRPCMVAVSTVHPSALFQQKPEHTFHVQPQMKFLTIKSKSVPIIATSNRYPTEDAHLLCLGADHNQLKLPVKDLDHDSWIRSQTQLFKLCPCAQRPPTQAY